MNILEGYWGPSVATPIPNDYIAYQIHSSRLFFSTIMLPSAVTLGGAYDGRSLRLSGNMTSAKREPWLERSGAEGIPFQNFKKLGCDKLKFSW